MSARVWSAAFLLCVAAAAPLPAAADAPLIGVSWSNFQEERWRRDESALRAEVERLGGRYVSADAQSSTEKQIADVESLIARGAQVLVIVAQDADALHPAIALARAEGIPVIGYDRLIEIPGVFYLSFDNREVGRIQAREGFARRPSGRYVFIKGAATDPNANFVHAGQRDVLDAAIASGEIRIVGDQYVEGWLPETAQRTMEQILTANGNRVDAVVCSNDGMAGGVLAALKAQGLEGLPLSGQDGDHAALNRIARGLQTVSVWKDARELGRAAARVALELARGVPGETIEGARIWASGARGTPVNAILLDPVPITRENLDVVVDAGWITRAAVCRGATADPPRVCSGE